jgi:hypothetical protein
MIVAIAPCRSSNRAALPENVPSPEEIREMTAEIRKSWASRDFCRRSNSADYVEMLQMPLQPRRRGFWGQ